MVFYFIWINIIIISFYIVLQNRDLLVRYLICYLLIYPLQPGAVKNRLSFLSQSELPAAEHLRQ
jgi:hypothetical protein